MTRRLARLTLDNLEDLPDPCGSCVFWELNPGRRSRAAAAGAEEDEKQSWFSGVLLEWGNCGQVLYVDELPAGYLTYAPAAYVPGAGWFATSPVSPDAVLLVTGAVYPGFTGGGLGRMLVQGMARDLVRRGGIRAVEAFGDTQSPADHRPGCRRSGRAGSGPLTDSCVLPAEFLLRVGFKTHRAQGRYHRMRLELSSVLTWREELEGAVEKLLGAVRPTPVRPAPSRGVRRTPRRSGG